METLTRQEIDQRLASEGSAWRYDAGVLVRSVTCATFMDGIRLVDAVAVEAERLDHHPDIDVRWTTITFRLWTHVADGVTRRDFRLADAIDNVVRALT